MAKREGMTTITIRMPTQVVEELKATAAEEGLTLTELCQGRLMRVPKHYLRRYKVMADRRQMPLVDYLMSLRLSHP